MGTIELDSKIKELRELRRMAEELQAEIDGMISFSSSLKTYTRPQMARHTPRRDSPAKRPQTSGKSLMF